MIRDAKILLLSWKTGHFPGAVLVGTCGNWTGDKNFPTECLVYSVLTIISFSQQLCEGENVILHVLQLG